MREPTHYQFVRDRREWDAKLVALDPNADGNLTLSRLPGPPDGNALELPLPYALGASGIASGPCEALFIADTDNNCILFLDGVCKAHAQLPAVAVPGSAPGQFDHPRDLTVAEDGLWVTDTGNARVQRFAFPALELDLELAGNLKEPTSVGIDSEGRVYVLDRALKTARRYNRLGLPDRTYNANISASGRLVDPLFLAVDDNDRLLVSDGVTRTVRCFNANGAFLHEISLPERTWEPGALVAGADRLYVADRSSGHIDIFLANGSYWCELQGFRGPVTAMALSGAGDLLIKTGLDGTYFTFPAGKAYAVQGTATAGPYDAGDQLEWFRAACQAWVPLGTALVFEVAQQKDPTPAPRPQDWVLVKGLDTLLHPLLPKTPPSLPPPTKKQRYLWLRATLSTRDSSLSPLLHNIRAETEGEDYRDYLPEIYRRKDEPKLFLFRLLALARSELGAVEENIDALPWLLAPNFAPYSDLPWLAQWLGLELPRIATDPERRALIERAVALYRRRGTPAGICDFIEIYTGVRPSLVEAFEERGIWILDVASELGFDTGLPAIDPLGMVVPDPDNPVDVGAGCCATPVGAAVVGEAGPLTVAELGEPLFLDAAHRFTVFLPSYRAQESALVAEVRRVIEAEKPAHTDYHLCLVEPDLRVGFQARVGIDTIVGGPPTPLRLDMTRLGLETTLRGIEGDAARIGQGASVGYTTILR
jgi:phage tail-like protein